MILFICKANVGRSQIAEALYNKKYGPQASVSIAGCEARKEKYNGVPERNVIDFMKEIAGIDMSSQRIKYAKDILNLKMIESIEMVIYLFDPSTQTTCDSECLLFGKSPYEYLLSQGIPIEVYEVEDPFEIGEPRYVEIYQDILEIVDTI